MKTGILSIIAFVLAGCATLKPTAISLAQPVGYESAKWAYAHKPAIAPAIISDIRAGLGDILAGQTILPDQLKAWEAKEAPRLGLSPGDVQVLDGLLQGLIVQVQAMYAQTLKDKLGVTATAILINFDAGVTQAAKEYGAK